MITSPLGETAITRRSTYWQTKSAVLQKARNSDKTVIDHGLLEK